MLKYKNTRVRTGGKNTGKVWKAEEWWSVWEAMLMLSCCDKKNIKIRKVLKSSKK